MWKSLIPILFTVSCDAFLVSPHGFSHSQQILKAGCLVGGSTWATGRASIINSSSCKCRIICVSITRLFENDNDFDAAELRTAWQQFALVNKQEENLDDDVHNWSPQDLTHDSPGFAPIPEDDYIKIYQNNPELWPVEFFFIAYRRLIIPEKIDENKHVHGIEDVNARELEHGQQHAKQQDNSQIKTKVQILVRKSANGTAKYGLGTGVPVTRWMASSQQKPPSGYQISQPEIIFHAANFPEFRGIMEREDQGQLHGCDQDQEESWTYTKINIKEDAFNNPDYDDATHSADAELNDPHLEEYAKCIRNEARKKLSTAELDRASSFKSKTISVVRNILDSPNSIAGIQGSLRMSGLFAKRDPLKKFTATRYVNFDDKAVDPTTIAESMRVYTMFPQMPDPLPSPSTAAEDLRKEIESRPARMVASGRDPHKDKHGRYYTHISTSNVSNTIHGIYFTIDCTDIHGLEDVPALDVFGTKRIEKEWVSLEDLKVLEDSDGKSKQRNRCISTKDTKPTFISGFIVRQLVKEGVIKLE